MNLRGIGKDSVKTDASISSFEVDTLDSTKKVEDHFSTEYGVDVTATYEDNGTTIKIDNKDESDRHFYIHKNRAGGHCLCTGKKIPQWPEDEPDALKVITEVTRHG